MKVKALLILASALSLAACAAPDSPPPHRHDDGHRHEHRHEHRDRDHRHDRADRQQSRPDRMANVRTFSCENGLSVQVRNLNSEQLELRLDDKRAVLSSAVAASGERYTASSGLFGRGAEWHQKGGEAFFGFTDPYGNQVETSCRARR